MIKQAQELLNTATEGAGRGGDIGRWWRARIRPDRDIVQGRHHAWFVAGADLGAVFIEGAIANVVHTVLDRQVATYQLGQLGRGDVVPAEVAGRVNIAMLTALGSVLARVRVSSTAPEVLRLLRARRRVVQRGREAVWGGRKREAVSTGLRGLRNRIYRIVTHGVLDRT